MGGDNLIDARLQRLKLEGTPRIKREKRIAAPPMSPIPLSADFSDFMLSMQHTGGSLTGGVASADPTMLTDQNDSATGGDAFGPGGMVGGGERSSFGSSGGGGMVDYGSLARKMMDDLFAGGTSGLTEFGGMTAMAQPSTAAAGAGADGGNAASPGFVDDAASPSAGRTSRRSRTVKPEISPNDQDHDDDDSAAHEQQDDDLPGSMRRPRRGVPSRSARPPPTADDHNDGSSSPVSPSPNPYSLAQPRNITPMSIPEGLLWTLREDDTQEHESDDPTSTPPPRHEGLALAETPGSPHATDDEGSDEPMEVLSPQKGKHEVDEGQD